MIWPRRKLDGAPYDWVTWAASAEGDRARGHLAAGTLGDVTILSGDITSGTPDEIRALEVIATIVDGNVAYCFQADVCGPD